MRKNSHRHGGKKTGDTSICRASPWKEQSVRCCADAGKIVEIFLESAQHLLSHKMP